MTEVSNAVKTLQVGNASRLHVMTKSDLEWLKSWREIVGWIACTKVLGVLEKQGKNGKLGRLFPYTRKETRKNAQNTCQFLFYHCRNNYAKCLAKGCCKITESKQEDTQCKFRPEADEVVTAENIMINRSPIANDLILACIFSTQPKTFSWPVCILCVITLE